MNAYQMMNPEAFTEEWEDEQRVLRQLAQEKAESEAILRGEALETAHLNLDDDGEIIEERDLSDIVREHEESEDWADDLDYCGMYDGEY